MDKRHEIILEAVGSGELPTDIVVRCVCGMVLGESPGDSGTMTLVDLNALVSAHYAFVLHPELANGKK